jgi:hypothetical protein
MNDSVRSEDWLALLLYGLDLFLDPKPYKFLQNFEAWDYDNRLRPRLYQLERAKLLERRGQGKHRLWALTPGGRLAAYDLQNIMYNYESNTKWRLRKNQWDQLNP